MPPENKDRIRVRTICITAPQQIHRIGARPLIQSDARPGLNFNTSCNKSDQAFAIGMQEAEVACPPKSFRQHMLQHQPQKLRAG